MNKKIILIIAIIVLIGGGVWYYLNSKSDDGCIQVITYAKNPQTGECEIFPNPCIVPENWEECEPAEVIDEKQPWEKSVCGNGICEPCESEEECCNYPCQGEMCPPPTCLGWCPQDCENQEVKCGKAGGIWKKFGNGCMDSCDYARNPTTIYCTEALADGCDCGEDKCWNGNECEDN